MSHTNANLYFNIFINIRIYYGCVKFYMLFQMKSELFC